MKQRNIGGGLILIFLGMYFLLRQLGWIDLSLQQFVVNNWPLLLILAGVHFVLSRTSLWFITVILVAIVFLIWVGALPPLSLIRTETIQTPFAFDVPTHSAQLAINHLAPAASFRLQRGPAPKVEGTVLHVDRPPDTGIQTTNGITTVTLQQPQRRSFVYPSLTSRWNVSVPAHLPLHTTIHVKVGNIDLDFSGLNPQHIQIALATGQVRLMFDDSLTNAHVQLDTNVAATHISVPEHVGLRVTAKGDLFSDNLKHLNLISDGDALISPNYADATRFLHIETKTNVGTLNITRYSPDKTATPAALQGVALVPGM